MNNIMQTEKVNGMEIMREIKEFAKNDNLFELITGNKIYTKHKYKDTIFLYSKNYCPSDTEYTIESIYEYVGFYNLKQSKFFNLQYPLSIYMENATKSVYQLKNMILKDIKHYVVKALTENTTIFDELKAQTRHETDEDFFINEIYYDIFIDNGKRSLEDYIELEYSNYRMPPEKVIKYPDLDVVLDYINDFAKVVERYEKEFLEKRLDELFTQFENYKIYSRKFDKIMSDKLNAIHRRKAVKEAVKDKKTVSVTILKDGQTFTFKVETYAFLHISEKYPAIYIPNPDRRKYEKLFGNNYFVFDEILNITYGKKEIYNKEHFGQQ